MKEDYYVIDGLIPEKDQLILYDYVKNHNIKWEVMENITGQYGGKKYTHKFPGKVHPRISCENEEIKVLANKIQHIVSEHLNLEFLQNYRWKINWTSPLGHPYDPMDLLHQDRMEEHIAMVYYINDSDGDTNIYNNKLGNNAGTHQSSLKRVDFDSYELMTNVSPKMGRCLIFNGKFAHQANYPTLNDRFIINFNFVAKSSNINKKML
jgi:hypothetical protein